MSNFVEIIVYKIMFRVDNKNNKYNNISVQKNKWEWDFYIKQLDKHNCNVLVTCNREAKSLYYILFDYKMQINKIKKVIAKNKNNKHIKNKLKIIIICFFVSNIKMLVNYLLISYSFKGFAKFLNLNFVYCWTSV
jgi:hypothetical protein